MSNVLEGIPLTVTAGGLCAARPACMLVICLALLGLLLWRAPNAVRLSQVAAVVVTALMCVCCAAVLANVVSPSDGAESAATYIGLVVSALNGVLGMLEIVALLLAVIPSAVTLLGLRSRTLEALCCDMGSDADDDQELLVLPTAMPTQSSPPQSQPADPDPTCLAAKDAKQREDEAWARSLIAQVGGREVDD